MEHKNSLQIKCVIEDTRAIMPTKAHPSDIGYDLTAIDVFKKISDRTTLFETGIRVSPPPGYYIEILPRSSISKTGYVLANSVGVIDPHYTGTLKIALTKVDDTKPDLKPPFNRCQIVLRKAEVSEMVQVKHLDETDRGDGGFGSTDKPSGDLTNMFNLFLFTQSDGPGILREVQYLNKPKNTPKNELYQWQWLPNGIDIFPLTFESSSSDTGNMCTRVFTKGKLVFSKESNIAVFTYVGKHYTLNRLSIS